MSWPSPTPVDARNCILYGFVRTVGGTGVANVQVLVGPPQAWAETGITLESGQTFGEGFLEELVDVRTNASGYWEIELRRGEAVRVQIARLKLDVTGEIPDAVRQDFYYWSYTPQIIDARKFVPNPQITPAVVDTSLLIRVDQDLQAYVLNLFDQLKVWAAPTRNGTYVEVTDVGTRLELVDGLVFYEFYQAATPAGQWYRASYYNSARSIDSPKGPPFKCDPKDYTEILTVDELKENYLFGVSLIDDFGKPYSRNMFENYIEDAIGWISRELDLDLAPTAVVEYQDFFFRDYYNWGRMQLDHVPVIAIDSISFSLGGATIFDVPSSWWKIDALTGTVELVAATPGSPTTMLTSLGGGFDSLLLRYTTRIPDYIRIAYRHGLPLVPTDSRTRFLRAEIKNLVAYRASFGPLDIAGDMLGGAGIASASMGQDGVSQSYSTTSSSMMAGYGARLAQYTKEIKERLPALKRYLWGIRAVVA